MTLLLAATLIGLILLVADRLRSGERVVVTTRQLESYRGVRRPTLRPAVMLTDVEQLHPEGPQRYAGRLAVPRRNVALVQELGERVEVVGLPRLRAGQPDAS